MKRSIFLLAVFAANPVFAQDVSFDVDFRLHVADGVAEQDVYVEQVPGSDNVQRPGPEFADRGAALYASTTPQSHAPTDPKAVGPFPKGKPLDVTLGEWLNASGAGQYSCSAGQGRLNINFEGLVPGGVYTLWHFFMVNGATDPFIGTFDLPVGELDGSQATFIADSAGNAVFDQTLASCLQLTGNQLVAGLAVNWHSDGKTYGVEPGAFGQSAHIQLYTDLPAAKTE
ncbi:MAG: hypothetical protein AAF362_00690 [Pseudomonadota bacterium]